MKMSRYSEDLSLFKKNILQNEIFLNRNLKVQKTSPYFTSLSTSISPTSGLSLESDGRSSSCSPKNSHNNLYSSHGYACSHCNSSFLTKELLEKHEIMHISNATMVKKISSSLILCREVTQSYFSSFSFSVMFVINYLQMSIDYNVI